jgi:hypothetical protein
VAGDHIDTIYADINRYSLYAFGALAVLLAAYLAWRVTRRRKGARAAAGSETAGSETAGSETGPERHAPVTPARSDAQGS